MDFKIYKNDLENLFPTFTMSDTTVGSSFTAKAVVTIGGALVDESLPRLSILSAYRDLRNKLIDGEDPLPNLTNTQMIAITDVDDGFEIFNLTFQQEYIFHNSAWQQGGGPAYGSMYEDNATGSVISSASSYTGWVTATSGTFDGNTIVTFSDNATADRIVIGTSGAGDYSIAFHASVTNSGGKLTTAAIHVNDVEQISIKMSLTGDSAKAVHLAGAGIIPLSADDYVDLRFMSENADDITVFQTNLTAHRIS